MKTIETNGAYIELTDIGGDDFPTLYAYTILYKGVRRAGNVDIQAHIIDNDQLVAATVLTHAQFADDDVIALVVSEFGKVLANMENSDQLGRLVLDAI